MLNKIGKMRDFLWFWLWASKLAGGDRGSGQQWDRADQWSKRTIRTGPALSHIAYLFLRLLGTIKARDWAGKEAESPTEVLLGVDASGSKYGVLSKIQRAHGTGEDPVHTGSDLLVGTLEHPEDTRALSLHAGAGHTALYTV